MSVSTDTGASSNFLLLHLRIERRQSTALSSQQKLLLELNHDPIKSVEMGNVTAMKEISDRYL